ncbi:MAG: YggS family pyridoxal phosphate-dependent enzyme, partial [Blastocatellia bacterium]
GRLALVQERIAKAAERAGRSPSEITLIAVSKTVAPSIIQQAIDAGIKHLGENRVQEAAEKVELIKGNGLRWHLIGHLQSNKARTALLTFDVIQTIDSVELVKRLDRLAGELNRRPQALVQVKLGDEPTKSGADEHEAERIIEALDGSANLRLTGLMGIAPLVEVPEGPRPYFRRLREFMEKVNRARSAENRLTALSMGMSGDFEPAIQEGATIVRIGTAIFGARG